MINQSVFRVTPIILISLFATVIFVNPPVFAASSDIDNTKKVSQDKSIYPNSFYYPLKRLWEKIRISFAFTNDAKIKVNQDLLDERLAELIYILDNNKLSYIETSSQRFAYFTGQLAENLKTKRDANLNARFKDKFKDYSEVLQSKLGSYPSNSSYWLLIKQDMDTLEILSNQL